ncbi:MAG: hypothetical protein JKY00_06605 [Roseicyclus sp.]|nr:hypothetical protein [Roseicyclus sp.]
MTGPKLTAMILFGALAFVFGVAFTIGLNSYFGALVTGAIAAALTCTLIWFAQTGTQAFARGFLALGAVFIIVPIAALSGFGGQIAESTVTALETGEGWSEEFTSALFLTSILASAGLVFGIIVGLILVLIGGLMHRPVRPTPSNAP